MRKESRKRHLKRTMRRDRRKKQRHNMGKCQSLLIVSQMALFIVLTWYQLEIDFSIPAQTSRSLTIDEYLNHASSKASKENTKKATEKSQRENQNQIVNPEQVFYTKPLTVDLNETLPWAIFFNIFIPTDQGQAGVERSQRIVSEQIDYIRRSYSVNVRRNKTVTVFYNTIGDGAGLPTAFIDDLCTGHKVSPGKNNPWPAIRCHHLAHYSQAFEEVTLQRMHDFCTENPKLSVSYIHSKGSYHDHQDRRNEYWRRHGTLAALNKDCVDPPDARCNVCGLAFYTLWAPFFPGNFFTAKCSYVRQLLAPFEFAKRMEEITKVALSMKSQGIFEMNLYSWREDFYGISRYSSEHWIASHPSLEACDLSEDSDFGFWLTGNHWSKNFTFGMGPRHKGSPGKDEVSTIEKVEQNRMLRLKEYFFLAGRIFKYFELYGEAPKSTSWVWKWFPDGEKWRRAVAVHGKQAVEITIQQKLGLVQKA